MVQFNWIKAIKLLPLNFFNGLLVLLNKSLVLSILFLKLILQAIDCSIACGMSFKHKNLVVVYLDYLHILDFNQIYAILCNLLRLYFF